MPQFDPTTTLLSTMAMTVAMFGALCSVLETKDRSLFRVLALFFLAVAMTEIGTALSGVVDSVRFNITIQALWIVGITSVVPLLWHYVWLLTAERNGIPPRFIWHLLVPALGLLAFITVVALPLSQQERLFLEQTPSPQGALWFVAAAFELLAAVIVPLQWGLYLALIARRLIRYRSRLKDLFASTESKEMRWIVFVVGFSALFWALNVVSLFLVVIASWNGLPELPEEVLNLVLCVTLAAWGLRQRPGLRGRPEQVPEMPKRYAKSALSTEMAERIAGKLRQAMERDRLYLDPNLSLWALSSHVRVSDNYVSQVLNERIGQNFFDFVNAYRIEAAKLRMREGTETVLEIAYDVGFNSRSSFYTAFKKVTGQTPSAYRKTPA